MDNFPLRPKKEMTKAFSAFLLNEKAEALVNHLARQGYPTIWGKPVQPAIMVTILTLEAMRWLSSSYLLPLAPGVALKIVDAITGSPEVAMLVKRNLLATIFP